jgi:hypothetical protein
MYGEGCSGVICFVLENSVWILARRQIILLRIFVLQSGCWNIGCNIQQSKFCICTWMIHYIHTCTHTYIHTYVRTHTQTHIHTCIRMYTLVSCTQARINLHSTQRRMKLGYMVLRCLKSSYVDGNRFNRHKRGFCSKRAGAENYKRWSLLYHR